MSAFLKTSWRLNSNLICSTAILGMIISYRPIRGEEISTIEAKVQVFSQLADAAARNRSKLRTWSGRCEFESSFYIPSASFSDFAKTVSEEPIGSISVADEFIIQHKSGAFEFQRVVEKELLALQIKDHLPSTFLGSSTEHSYLEATAARNERAIVTPNGIFSYKPDLSYGVPSLNSSDEIGDGRAQSTVVVTIPRKRMNGPVWPLDTDPWHGEYADPMCFYGVDRPTDTYLESYIKTLQGKFGEQKATLVDSWLKVTLPELDQGGRVVVEIRRPSGTRHLEFTDLWTGNLVRYRELDDGGDGSLTLRPVAVEVLWEYSQVDGVQIPLRINRRTFNPATGNPVSEINYSIEDTQVNPVIDGAVFEESSLQAPSNAWKLIKSDEGTKLVSPSAQESDSPKRIRWVVIANFALAGVFCLFVYMRMRKLKVSPHVR